MTLGNGRAPQPPTSPPPPPPTAVRPTTWRQVLKRVLGPFVAVFAVLYFLIDALFYWLVKPIADWLGRRRILEGVRDWIRSLGPYPTLALFLVPVIVLEPVKPVALYLLGTGQFMAGTLVLVIGELLKITLVERLFHLGKDKLMMIAAFAWAYGFVMRWLDYLKSLPPWQAVLRLSRKIKARARLIYGALKSRSRSIAGELKRRWAAFWTDPA
jgi:hypothetical protein